MINHLGNQLERRFFINERKNSHLNLPFEHIGTLCFNLGDSFEYFLEEGLYKNPNFDHFSGSNPFQEMHHRQNQILPFRLKALKSLVSGGVVKEQSFRVELMDYVILDTLLQFYGDEMDIEFDEDDLEIVELADFVEDVMVEFIRKEGKSLLQYPNDPAIDYFEELLDKEEDFDADIEDDWDDEDDGWFEDQYLESEWDIPFADIPQTIKRFVDECKCTPPETIEEIVNNIELFNEYLTEHAELSNIYELNDDHFLEFFSIWLVRKFAQEDTRPFQQIFQTLARFVSWLHQNYNIDHKKAFLNYYEQVKTEVPRVVDALQFYLNDYDLFEIILSRGHPDSQQKSGFYEIHKMRGRIQKTVDLVALRIGEHLDNVKLNSNVFSKLKTGDVLQATLIERGHRWEILEIHYIYPTVSKPFVH